MKLDTRMSSAERWFFGYLCLSAIGLVCLIAGWLTGKAGF